FTTPSPTEITTLSLHDALPILAHQRNTSLAEQGREQIYFVDGFLGHGAAGRWAIRTRNDPARYAASIRSEIDKFDPQMLITQIRSEEHTSELQSRFDLVCRLLL